MGRFSSQLAKFESKTLEKADRVMRRTSLDVLRRLIVRSPVDTGRFRGNWATGINQIPTANDKFDKTGSVTIQEGADKVGVVKYGDSVFIVNNLPYALPLENGHSQQAPGGMVAITVAEWPGIVAAALDAEK